MPGRRFASERHDVANRFLAAGFLQAARFGAHFHGAPRKFLRHHPGARHNPLTGALEVRDSAPIGSGRAAASKLLTAAAACLILGSISPGTVLARASTPPSSFGRDGRAADQTEWHLHIGQAFRDTVSANAPAARVAAMAALADDHWELEPSGAVLHLLTQWKPIHHLLFRMFSGKAFGRVFVDVKPLPRHRSEIRFQGMLATHRDIEHNPAKGWAEHAYASAVRVWQQEVRDELARAASVGADP